MSSLAGKIDVVIAVGYAAEKSLLNELKPADNSAREWCALQWALALV
jgi:hypothetical protein